MLALAGFLVGILLLVKGSQWVIDGGASLGRRFNISPLVVGLTIVAFGGSAPELFISVNSALNGYSELALNNIMGSNLVNILLILSVAAIIKPIKLHKDTVFKEIPFSFLATFVLLVLASQSILEGQTAFLDFSSNLEVGNGLGLMSGLILLSFFIIFLYYTFGISKKVFDIEEINNTKLFSIKNTIVFLSLGFVGLVIGSQWVIQGAIYISEWAGLSQGIVGLTIVSLGTSLPELVTTSTAALKGKTSIAVGNIVGSNIFNIFLILGLTSVLTPVTVSLYNLLDMIVLLMITAFLFLSVFVFRKYELGKLEGLSLIFLYIIYIMAIFLRVG